MKLDDRDAVLTALRAMRSAGRRAHNAASEEQLTGPVRDLIFGLNTAVDALVSLIEAES